MEPVKQETLLVCLECGRMASLEEKGESCPICQLPWFDPSQTESTQDAVHKLLSLRKQKRKKRRYVVIGTLLGALFGALLLFTLPTLAFTSIGIPMVFAVVGAVVATLLAKATSKR